MEFADDLLQKLRIQEESYGHFGRNDLELPWESVEEKAIQLVKDSKKFF